MIKVNDKKKQWVKPVFEVLKFEDTKGPKLWQGASVEGAGDFIHESKGDGFFHRINDGASTSKSNASDTKTALDSSAAFYKKASFGPS